MFANNKDCRQYQYGEQPEISSLDDLFTLYGPCGFYGVSAKVVADLASGLDKSVRLEPTANQEILGDFDLTFTGFSLLTVIRPGSLSLVSRSSGGLSAVTSADGSTLFKSKGVDVVRYDENGVNMLESLKMPINYTSTDANDVVVKAELTAVDDASAKINEENTFSEKQTLEDGAEVTGLINNTDSGIKHNIASFRVDAGVADGADALQAGQVLPAGWSIIKNSTGNYTLDYGQVFAIIPQPITQPVFNPFIDVRVIQSGQTCDFLVIDSTSNPNGTNISILVAY